MRGLSVGDPIDLPAGNKVRAIRRGVLPDRPRITGGKAKKSKRGERETIKRLYLHPHKI